VEEEKKERPNLRWMDDVEIYLRNMGVKEEEELWTEQNGQLS
jgi:hypothetical protein